MCANCQLLLSKQSWGEGMLPSCSEVLGAFWHRLLQELGSVLITVTWLKNYTELKNTAPPLLNVFG